MSCFRSQRVSTGFFVKMGSRTDAERSLETPLRRLRSLRLRSRGLQAPQTSYATGQLSTILSSEGSERSRRHVWRWQVCRDACAWFASCGDVGLRDRSACGQAAVCLDWGVRLYSIMWHGTCWESASDTLVHSIARGPAFWHYFCQARPGYGVVQIDHGHVLKGQQREVRPLNGCIAEYIDSALGIYRI